MNRIGAAMLFALAVLGSVALMVGGVFYAVFLEQPWLSYRNLPFPPQLQQVKPGQIVPLLVERCNSANTPQVYYTTHSIEVFGPPRTFVIMANVQVSIEPGCSSGVSLINRVPAETPPGRARVTGVAEVKGLLRTHQVEWYSMPFEVVP